MKRIRTIFARLMWRSTALLFTGCMATVNTINDYPLKSAPPPYTETGEITYTVTTGTYIGVYNRPGEYEVYLPADPKTDTIVVLTHGFMRDLSAMRGWAALWSSYGVPVAVVTTRNSTWLTGRHDRNAADLRVVARQMNTTRVIYAGYSSGGLAALLAAAEDPNTVAYLGLDAVDTGDLALRSAERVTFPTYFIFGEPSACNAQNNMVPATRLIPDAMSVRVNGATHCHFEDPYSEDCENVCGSVQPTRVSKDIYRYIHSLATAWILQQTGTNPEARSAARMIEQQPQIAEVLK